MVIGEQGLRERMQRPLEQRLIVTPLLSPGQIAGGSVDVRLGTEFILMKRSAKGPIDPINMGTESSQDYQERVHVDVGDKMILHPNQLVLGVTLEFIQVPEDLMAYVIGRSSWGRLGLMVATAVMVSPGYRGSLTLELANLADTPVYLYPGTRVAQLVFHQVEGTHVAYANNGGKYTGPVGPEFSKLSLDQDWQAIKFIGRDPGNR
ncbi:MAG: dCTP deaminase [Firmicutes bacterium]|jgi:dCTP deaminase|uniref:dCTP deaminase n=1 Tax=Sulfobacillus benefaciens TaxID=453960 RepID=A0A2T2X6K2_9FIRM|nr:dCTP deaminase [Bacillota bacterium]MCL5015670.1 dCTP deaminase [Bacillota bacterium]PSR30097.1 MAG: dCTP deaminase [Sulfobacillus benefaciens]